jgi:hypothetical protein
MDKMDEMTVMAKMTIAAAKGGQLFGAILHLHPPHF